jgi:hypothetical protein
VDPAEDEIPTVRHDPRADSTIGEATSPRLPPIAVSGGVGTTSPCGFHPAENPPDALIIASDALAAPYAGSVGLIA